MLWRRWTTAVAAYAVLGWLPARAGDYDQAMLIISKVFPEIRKVGVFYDGSGTLLNLLEFESSAFKEFGLGINLVPLDPKQRTTHESIRTLCTRNRIQAILLLDGDPLVKPGSPVAQALLAQGGHIPVVGIQTEWLKHGAWFVVGPQTKGLQINPKGRDAKTLEALRLAGEALPKEAP